MEIDKIIKLAWEATKGKDNFKEGTVGSNGYGFVFKDLDAHLNNPYIFDVDSQKLCGAGAYRAFSKKLQKHDKVNNFTDLLRYDPNLDLLFAGSIKTLAPTLQFGGFERLFDIWMFVITPENQMFPAIFYWRQSGLSIGGWTSYGVSSFLKKRIFPENFSKLINFGPFEFNEEEQNLFLDALEFALKKVPVSDFWGVYRGDFGYVYMGVKKGKPFSKRLADKKLYEIDSEIAKKLEPLLGKEFKDPYGESFCINLVHDMKIYVIEFEHKINGDNKLFLNAKDVLDFYKKFINEKKKSNLLT